MFKKLGLALAAVIVLILVAAAVKSPDFAISRSTTIAASAADVFPHVNEPMKTNAWNPFLAMDPQSKVTYEGPAAGVGAVTAWESEQTGNGRSEIIASVPNEKVNLRIQFFKPMESEGSVEYALKEENGRTTLTWTMSGRNAFPFRVMGLFFNVDQMIGGEFEKGLATLKGGVEASKASATLTN